MNITEYPHESHEEDLQLQQINLLGGAFEHTLLLASTSDALQPSTSYQWKNKSELVGQAEGVIWRSHTLRDLITSANNS